MKSRAVFSCAIAGASLAATGFSMQDGLEGFTYRAPGGGWFQVAGVCNADVQHITCWTPTGEEEPKLTELLNAYFLINPGQRMDVRYKHRTLMLVTKQFFTPGASGVGMATIQVEPGPPIYQSFTIGYNTPGNDSASIYWFYPPDEVSNIDVSGLLTTTTGPEKIDLKAGASAHLKGGKVTITGIKKLPNKPANPPNPYMPPQKGPQWDATYSIQGEGDEPITLANFTAYNRHGDVIESIDDRGNPIKRQPGQFNSFDGPFRQSYPLFVAQPGHVTLGVKPDKVGYLMVTGSSNKKVTFKNVSLKSPR